MKIEDSGIKTDLFNANDGTKRGLVLLDKSLRKLGAGRSILVDKDGNVIAGNKTVERAADIGLSVRIVETDGNELVVVKRTDLDLYSDTDTRARQLAYADNKVSELDLSWNQEMIDINFEPLDLGEWGFDVEESKEEIHEYIEPREMCRILISIPIDLVIDARDILDKLNKIVGIEVLYGAN